ncbi:cation:proton antiporter [Pseudactinotalea sp.]|uniref:cation:proton antiporter n=1 Tax=Pseudactinotalea sp. TaxID=1926260 RepID=UPI003B3A3D1A
MTALSVTGQVFMVLGALIFISAAAGLWRLRDVYARGSSVATAAGLGVVFVTVGAVLTDPEISSLIKVALAVALQLLTSALGAITIARSAALSGHPFAPGTDIRALTTHERTP